MNVVVCLFPPSWRLAVAKTAPRRAERTYWWAMVPPDPAPPVDDSWWSSVVRSLVCGTTPRVGKSPAGAARRLEAHLGDDVDSRYLELAGMRLRASELDSEIEGLKRTLTGASPPATPEAPPSEPALTERALAQADQLWSGLVNWGSPAVRDSGGLQPPPPPPVQAARAARLNHEHDLEQERQLRRRRQEDGRAVRAAEARPGLGIGFGFGFSHPNPNPNPNANPNPNQARYRESMATLDALRRA